MNLKAESYAFLEDVRGATRGGATDRVVDALRQAIVSLELQPGAVLDKQALCDRLGVSRFPVSEALSRLQAEGLVEIRPQSGTSVARIRLADARENLFLRRALEAEAVRALAPAIDAATLDLLKRNLRYQKAAAAAGDRAGFHALDVAFHELLFSALGFERVKATVDSARKGLDRIRQLLATKRRQSVTYREHEAIVKALEAGDGKAAAAAMSAHLDEVMQELLTFAAARPEIFADSAAPLAAEPPKKPAPRKGRGRPKKPGS